MTIHHGDCGHIKLHWDKHKKCINCSYCSRESTCSTYSSWPNSVWNLAENRTYSSRKKAKSSRKKSQNPSVSSDERKKKHGSTAPHGVTGRDKTHICGISLGTCTQGSTSPPTTGHQSPTTDPQAISQLPNGQEDISGQLGMPGHRPLGMPGHLAPAPGQSPNGQEDISGRPGMPCHRACLVTGHRACPVNGHQPPGIRRPPGKQAI